MTNKSTAITDVRKSFGSNSSTSKNNFLERRIKMPENAGKMQITGKFQKGQSGNPTTLKVPKKEIGGWIRSGRADEKIDEKN
jgi:hypothetical protein